MESDEVNDLIEGIKIFTEALGGMRRALLAQGFSEETAETLCIISAEKFAEAK